MTTVYFSTNCQYVMCNMNQNCLIFIYLFITAVYVTKFYFQRSFQGKVAPESCVGARVTCELTISVF